MKLSIVDIWKIFCELVANYPTQTSSYLQPQTFAVLQEPSDTFNSFAKDYKYYHEESNRNLFYSRAWEADGYDKNKVKAEFPSLIAFNNQLTGRLLSSATPIYTVDLYIADIDRDNELDVRKWEIIDKDLEVMLLSILKEFKSYVYTRTDGWQSINKLEADNIAEYEIVGYMSTQLKNRGSLQLERGWMKSKSLQTLGVSLQIEGCVNLQSYSY